MITEPLPDWLAPSQSQFLRLYERLPHALLIQGEQGLAKSQLVIQMVAALLCDAPSQNADALQACGQCRNCVMFESGNHPDFHYQSTELFVEHGNSAHLNYANRYLEDLAKRAKRKPRRVISVDQIRALIDDFSLSHHSARHKVALIQPADAMNTNAANALLKLLEEPNPGSILILVSHDAARLPMTIRSRCVSMSVHLPAFEQAMAWLVAQGIEQAQAGKALAISGGAPIKAQAFIQDNALQDFKTVLSTLGALLSGHLSPIEAREAMHKLQNTAILISWLQNIISWMMAMTMHIDASDSAAWRAYQTELSALTAYVNETNLERLRQLYDDLIEMKKQDVQIIQIGLLLDKWLIAFYQRLRSV